MVIVYEMSDKLENRKGHDNKSKNMRKYRLVKYVTNGGRQKQRWVQVKRDGTPASDMWGGLKADGTPKAHTLEEARTMQRALDRKK